MGTGTDAARVGGPSAHANLIDNMKDQLIIVLMKRLAKNGRVIIPVAEIDNTGGDLLSFQIDAHRNFVFVLGKKS